jgi:hypothetical protein
MKILLNQGEINAAILEYLSSKNMQVGLNEIQLKCEWDQQYDSYPTSFYAEIDLNPQDKN